MSALKRAAIVAEQSAPLTRHQYDMDISPPTPLTLGTSSQPVVLTGEIPSDKLCAEATNPGTTPVAHASLPDIHLYILLSIYFLPSTRSTSLISPSDSQDSYRTTRHVGFVPFAADLRMMRLCDPR
jgi:hypothetical protein